MWRSGRRRHPSGLPARCERDPAELAAPRERPPAHLDFLVDDLDEVERRIVGLGGRPLETKGASGPHEERGYADPAGHSFTLRLEPSTAPKQG
ncbi:VOC family protein [Streptomyces sp. B21-108]|uniref:VOC family protein n=1 Tax=Streptomyces sp. B21-108 TaxID=3039419 RepID=UPI002FF0691A